jgi:hypothetical protein
MPISLPVIRSIAADVAFEEASGFEVLGTTKTEGSTEFAKVIFGHIADDADPEPFMIMVKRRLAEEALRDLLRDRLRAYLRTPT